MPATTYLPMDLFRWDRSPGGDALVVPVWSDVRPLRGAAGLLDWRLCGHLSQMIRQGRLCGNTGEKLLLVTNRVPWHRVLAVGTGESLAFDVATFRVAADCCLDALRRIGVRSLARACPGRDVNLIGAERALGAFRDALGDSERENGPWLERLTIIDAAASARASSKIPTTNTPSA